MIDWKDHIHRHLQAQNDEQSHTERDCNTFHPSALSRCKRQCSISKLGLETHGVNTLWNFYLGTRQHEDLENWFGDTFPGVEFERELSHEIEHTIPDQPIETVLRFTGRCDVYDSVDSAVYDFKTRKSWNGFDGASEAHKDQLTTYMKMAGVEKGQLIYLIKSAPWDESQEIVKAWPEDGWFGFDETRWLDIRERAKVIHDELRSFEQSENRLPESKEELPFEPCGCWLCNSEGDEQ